MSNLIFVVSDYFATGEGRTISVLVTYALPRKEDYETESTYEKDSEGNWKYNSGTLKNTSEERAKREFEEIFGGWFSTGCEILSEEEFVTKLSPYIPVFVKNYIEDPTGNFQYHFQLHLNLS